MNSDILSLVTYCFIMFFLGYMLRLILKTVARFLGGSSLDV